MLKVVGAASCFQEALGCGLVVRGFVRCAAVGTGFVRQRPRRRRRAWLGSQLKAGRAVLKSVVSDARWSRTFVVACHKLLGSPSGRLDRADGVANRPNKKRPQLPVDILALGS